MSEHPVKIQGASSSTLKRPVLIVERTDIGFLPVMLAELAGTTGLAKVEGQQATKKQDTLLKLFQPVQRTFNIALYELYCDRVGDPRLDPNRIDSAVLTVRRRAIDEHGNILPGRYEGWMETDKHLRGWQTITALDADPDPTRRKMSSLGHPELDRLLAVRQSLTPPMTERTTPLFIAPPNVGEATKKTLLYGLIPVTSSEISAPGTALPAYDTADIAKHIPPFLQAGISGIALPFPGQYVTAKMMSDAEQNGDANSTPVKFMTFLRQMAIEFDLFGSGAESKLLLQQLNGIILILYVPEVVGGITFPIPQPWTMGEWLRQACNLFVFGESTSSSVLMPQSWPTLNGAQGTAIVTAVGGAMSAQLKKLSAGEGRFDDPTRQYVIQAFVRVRRDDGCPPDLVPSDPSEPFLIAPWYENNQAVPPVKIALPDVTDRNLLKSLKPNVSFVLPENLFNFLQSNGAKKALTGDLSSGSGGIGLDWLCSFSLPLITLCAFIVLNIFLSLLNIVFFWLAFIKICIPIPKRK